MKIKYLGKGIYNTSTNLKEYYIWKNIFNRCFNLNYITTQNQIYKTVDIIDEWCNFQNFCQWYLDNSKWNIFGYDLEIDKDILVNINHLETKIYSPETCLLIPSELNCYLICDSPYSSIRIFKNKNNYSYQAMIVLLEGEKKRIYKSFSTFKEAKIYYAQEKYKDWIKLINKFELPNNLREILLQYDFSWSWLLNNMTEEEIREKYYTK